MRVKENIKVNNALNPKLWDENNKLRTEVREAALRIVEFFLSQMDMPITYKDIRILGSNASYNYSPYSDLDIHIVVDFNELEGSNSMLRKYFNGVRNGFLNDYDVKIHGIPVEMYIEDISDTPKAMGIYSVADDGWIKFPKQDTNAVEADVDSVADVWEARINKLVKRDSLEDVDTAIRNLYYVRRNSLAQDGEYGKGNQLFKEIRNRGLLDMLKQKKKELISKELSVEKKLCEDTRQELINTSRASAKGSQRYDKRRKSSFSTSVSNYNSMDMNKLFKDDILTVNGGIKGETDNYTVNIDILDIIKTIRNKYVRDGKKVDLSIITRALVECMNSKDIRVSCTCPDSRYRMAYHQTRTKVKSGEPELRPSDITNPNDTLGHACKHTLLVLQNNSWLRKVASAIWNYIKYIMSHYEKAYANIIYPALYGKPYEGDIQTTLFDRDTLAGEEDTTELDTANRYGKQSTQFQKGNTQGVRFAKEPYKGKALWDNEDKD